MIAATGCVSAPKSGWVRPYGDVAISAAGAESCRDQCKAGGYKYVEREAMCDTFIAVYAPMYTYVHPLYMYIHHIYT